MAMLNPIDAQGPDGPIDTRDLRSRLDDMRPVPRVTVQAFCETEEVAAALELAASDRRMAKAHMKAHRGGIEAACAFYESAATPNLVILESTALPTDLVASLEMLAEVCDPGSKVVVIGHHNDVFLYRELTRRGISEYLVAPVDLADILTVIAELFSQPDADPLGRTVAFVSAKGGAGSSTAAHNVAWSMSKAFESEVLLVDLDLPFGTANINFDQDPVQGALEALAASDRLDEALLDRLLARCAERLSLLAAPSILDRTYDFPAEAFGALIETAQRGTPTVVLDVPHVWSDWTRAVLGRADEIVITATPDLASLRNTKNLVDMLRKARPNDVPPRLILNQVGVPKRPEIAPAEFVEPLDATLLATIAFDPALFGAAANNGRMIGESDPKHPNVQIFNDIACTLTGKSKAKAPARSATPRLLKLFRRK